MAAHGVEASAVDSGDHRRGHGSPYWGHCGPDRGAMGWHKPRLRWTSIQSLLPRQTEVVEVLNNAVRVTSGKVWNMKRVAKVSKQVGERSRLKEYFRWLELESEGSKDLDQHRPLADAIGSEGGVNENVSNEKLDLRGNEPPYVNSESRIDASGKDTLRSELMERMEDDLGEGVRIGGVMDDT
ncbi:hypothetical protein NDU88_006904 [Pleurodeles waltl]|uniref:Uncharacterized protein n=1 Tax=Pleurodeles waltl TaxID=8319 RepID=A0AAV7WG00_PLEWA|nr:hypothetical protein NDU88_006904 [Pleurodeles waltl]